MTVQSTIEPGRLAVKERDLRDRLDNGIAPKLLPVYADIHDEIVADLRVDQITAGAREHAELLAGYCSAQSNEIARMTQAEQSFQTRLANAVDAAERRAAIMDFARELGADRKQLQRDHKALGAYFDAEAVIERFHKRIGERERALAHGLDRLGIISSDAVSQDPLIVESAFFVELSENLLAEMRGWRGDARVRCAAHRCMGLIAEKIAHWPFGYWFETILSATRRVAIDENEDIWVQCAAFDALIALSPNSMATAISSRIERPISQTNPQVRDNELFLRRYFGRLICANFERDPAFQRILNKLACDQSGAVRQAIVDGLHLLPAEFARQIFAVLGADQDPQVRGALFADVARISPIVTPVGYAKHITHILSEDSDEFVLRIALDAAAGLANFVRDKDLPEREEVFGDLRAAIVRFQHIEVSPKLLRWADETFERVWLASNADALEIAAIIRSVSHDQFEGDIRAIRALKPYLIDDGETVGRVMAVLSQNDFGLSLKPGSIPRIQRGEWIKRRFWRILFEGGNSATDKRQAFMHTTGRHYFGTMIAPSARMAELAPTKVPGEPLLESSEGGWRNYLPLVDQVLAAIDHGKTIEIFTSAGVTELAPPSALLTRLSRFWGVTRSFSELAEKRNRGPAEYLDSLRSLGFEITFRGYDEEKAANLHIARFFSEGGSSPCKPRS